MNGQEDEHAAVRPIMMAHTCRSALGDEFMGGTWYHRV